MQMTAVVIHFTIKCRHLYLAIDKLRTRYCLSN